MRIIAGPRPQEDMQKVHLINCALSDIDRYIQNFGAALRLFDYCKSNQARLPDFTAWQFVACRDAVLSIYHAKHSMIAASAMAFTNPLIIPHLDKDALGEASRKFKEWFPDWTKIRHGVAHAGELFRSVEAAEENAFSGTYQGTGIHVSGQGNMVHDWLEGRLYTTGFEGELVHCEISDTTLARLKEVMSDFYRGFQAIPSPLTAPDPQDQTGHQ